MLRYAFASDSSSNLMMNWIFFLPQEWFFSAWKCWLAEVSSPGACRQAKARRDRVSSSWGTDKVESVFHKVQNEQISGIFPCFVWALWVNVCLGALIETTFTSNRALYFIEWQCSQTSWKGVKNIKCKICMNLWISFVYMLFETRRLLGFTEGTTMFWRVKMLTGILGKNSI